MQAPCAAAVLGLTGAGRKWLDKVSSVAGWMRRCAPSAAVPLGRPEPCHCTPEAARGGRQIWWRADMQQASLPRLRAVQVACQRDACVDAHTALPCASKAAELRWWLVLLAALVATEEACCWPHMMDHNPWVCGLTCRTLTVAGDTPGPARVMGQSWSKQRCLWPLAGGPKSCTTQQKAQLRDTASTSSYSFSCRTSGRMAVVQRSTAKSACPKCAACRARAGCGQNSTFGTPCFRAASAARSPRIGCDQLWGLCRMSNVEVQGQCR